MEQRTLDITLIGAKDLKQVNLISKMDVYVVVSISGGHTKAQLRSPVDSIGNRNPNWNFPIKFTVDSTAADQNRLTVVFKLRCQRALGDRDIGEVHVPIKELLDGAGDGKHVQFVRYQVRKPSGKPQGELNFSYKFGEKVAGKADEPVTAYPAGHPVAGSSSGYPPPPQPYATGAGSYPPPAGYPPQPMAGYPPQHGYGYPPPQHGYGPPQPGYGPPQPGYGYPPQGYGYPPAQVQKPKKNKMGMGLGAGLLGGALGGLLIGDMISDAAYDGGFDDGGFDGGFDF